MGKQGVASGPLVMTDMGILWPLNRKGELAYITRSKPTKDKYRRMAGQRAHRLIVEQRTGIKLPAHAVVHHVDPTDKKTNTGPLVVCQDAEYHSIIERRTRAYYGCGNANWLRCKVCKQWDDPANIISRPRRTRSGRDRTGHVDYTHKLVRGKCYPKDAPLKRNYLAKARDEGIWRAVAEHEVECVICGLKSSTATFARAAHGRTHVADGTATTRIVDVSVEYRRKGMTKTIYEPVRPIGGHGDANG